MSFVSRRATLRLFASLAGAMLLSACSSVQPASPAAATSTSSAGASAPASTAASSSLAGSPSTAVASEPATPAAQPRSGGTLRLAITAQPPGLEGHLLASASQETTWFVYDRLTAYDDKLQPQPMLAESWELSNNSQQIKLNLRQGVQYHTGREFTSDDVKYNLLRVRDPKVGVGVLADFSNGFSSIETPDKYTVVLQSNSPRPGVFDGFEVFNMVDRDTMEGPDAKTKAVGTGPFTFVEWVQGDHLTFAGNKNYWQSGRPYLDGIITNIRDQQTMSVQLESGALDVVKNPLLSDYVRIKTNPSFQAFTHPNPGTIFEFGFNVNATPFDNKQVRQALNYALDRNRLAQTVLLGLASPLCLPWSQSSPAYDAAKNGTYAFDLNKARAMLDSAGVTALELDLLVQGAAQPALYQFAQIYQEDLSTIGVKVNVKNLDQATFNDQVVNLNYNGIWASSDGSTNLRPPSLLTVSPGWNPDANQSGFTRDDTYKQLVSSASAETDPARQQQLYAQINDFVLDQSWVMPLSTNPITGISRNAVRDIGFWVHNGAFAWTNAWLES